MSTYSSYLCDPFEVAPTEIPSTDRIVEIITSDKSSALMPVVEVVATGLGDIQVPTPIMVQTIRVPMIAAYLERVTRDLYDSSSMHWSIPQAWLNRALLYPENIPGGVFSTLGVFGCDTRIDRFNNVFLMAIRDQMQFHVVHFATPNLYCCPSHHMNTAFSNPQMQPFAERYKKSLAVLLEL